MRRRAGFGLALVVVVMVGLVLAAVLAAQAYFASGAASAVQRLLRAEQARVLAESALEEALVLISRDANGASGTGAEAWTKFRVKDGGGFELAVPLEKLEVLGRELTRYPLCQRPPPSIAARVRFQQSLDNSPNPLHDQRYGTLELNAAVSYELDRKVERRTLTRWYEFKVVQTTLPFPFDRTQVYIHDGSKIVNTNAVVFDDQPAFANLLIHASAKAFEDDRELLTRAAQSLQDRIDNIEAGGGLTPEETQYVGELRGALAQIRRGTAAVEAGFARWQSSIAEISQLKAGENPPFLLGFPLMAMAPAETTPGMKLEDYNLPVINRKLIAGRNKAQELLNRRRQELADAELQGADGAAIIAAAGALSDAVQGDLDAADATLATYQRFEKAFNIRAGDEELKTSRGYLDMLGPGAWTNSVTGVNDPVIRPGKAQFAIPKALCADANSMTRALGEVLDRYGPPFQGTVHVDNAGGAELVIDGDAEPRWKGYAGRLTIVTSGKCRVKNVTRANEDQHLLTVICQQELTAIGTVQASLVAFKRFLHPARTETTIKGHLVLDREAHELGADPDVEAVLADVVMKPDKIQPTTAESGAIKGDRFAVLIGPVPIYARLPRQEEQ